MFRSKKRAVAILGGLVATVAVATVAFAAFTSSGNFDANGTTHAAPVPLTVSSADSGIEAGLWPGGCVNVKLGFTNSNDHAAKINTAALGSAVLNVDGAGGLLSINPNLTSATPNADQTAANAAVAAFSVPAGGSASITIPNLVCLSNSATNAQAGNGIHVYGSVPFIFDNDTEFVG